MSPHALQRGLWSGEVATTVQINFNAAFDRVNHHGILNKLCSEGNVSFVLFILTQFFSKINHN